MGFEALTFSLVDLPRFSELEDVFRLAGDEAPTLSMLDSTLRRFMALCATYHGTCLKMNRPLRLSADSAVAEQYLQSPLQIEHACNLLIDSELFEFHSERMVEIIVDDAQTVSNHRNRLNLSNLDVFPGVSAGHGPAFCLCVLRGLVPLWSSSSRLFPIP